MQADLPADDPGGQELALDHLADREHRKHQADPNRVERELHQRHGEPGNHAQQHAEDGDEGDDARGQAQDQPEIQPDHGQSDAVEGAEQQADRRLAAHEAGERPVDLPDLLADGFGVGARQPSVDGGDDPVPIAQQVEGHHRRNHQERDQAEDRRAAAEQLAPQRHRPLHALGQIVAGGAAQARHLLRRQVRLNALDQRRQRRLRRLDHAGQGAQAVRQPVGELDYLVQQQRQQQDQQHGHQDKERPGHQAGGQRSRGPPGFEPVDHRIEEIGHQHAGHEWQHDAAERGDGDQEGGQDGKPDHRLAARRHRGASSISAAARPQRTR